jgi:CBS domain-containing protein
VEKPTIKKVAHILDRKGDDVWTIGPDSSVREALEVMADKNIGALVVVRDGNVIGIISERDYARKIILKGRSSMDARVAEIMTTDVAYVDPERTAEECMALMSDGHFRHLPVLREGQLVGLVSIGDVVKAVLSEREFVIDQLMQYIRGG